MWEIDTGRVMKGVKAATRGKYTKYIKYIKYISWVRKAIGLH